MSIASDPWPRRHLINVEQYYRMAEAGVLAPDARVELIEDEPAAASAEQGLRQELRERVLPFFAAQPAALEPLAEQEIHFCMTQDGVQLAYSLMGSGPPLVKTGN